MHLQDIRGPPKVLIDFSFAEISSPQRRPCLKVAQKWGKEKLQFAKMEHIFLLFVKLFSFLKNSLTCLYPYLFFLGFQLQNCW